MTSNDRRRFKRLIMAGAICFLLGALLSQSGDRSGADFQVYLATILVLVGMVLCLKAFGTILYTEDHVEYTYEDDIEDHVEYTYEDGIEDQGEVQYENLPREIGHHSWTKRYFHREAIFTSGDNNGCDSVNNETW